jgi:hypothetical protein
MATIADAREVKEALKGRLVGASWLRGVGLGTGHDGGSTVRVNVSRDDAEIRSSIPSSMNGVPIEIHVVDDIEAQSWTRSRCRCW